MCEGEFESLKAIHAVTPDFVPKPYDWGKYKQNDPETYFLLAEFREVGKQVRAVVSQIAGKHATYASIFHAQTNINFSGNPGSTILSHFLRHYCA